MHYGLFLGTVPHGRRMANVKRIRVGCWKIAPCPAKNARTSAPITRFIATNGRPKVNVRKIPNIWTSTVPDHAENAQPKAVRTKMIIALLGVKKATARAPIMPTTWNFAAKKPVDFVKNLLHFSDEILMNVILMDDNVLYICKIEIQKAYI